MGFLDREKRLLTKRNAPDPPLVVDASGFSFDGINPPIHVTWSDVSEIRVFKIDLMAVDEIRVLFGLTSGFTVEISEEQSGFREVMSAVEVHFPSSVGWYARVVLPPFARNETVLYEGVRHA